MITKDNLKLSINDNNLDVVIENTESLCRIKTYQLAYHNKIYKKQRISNFSTSFKLNRSGNYQLRVTYYDGEDSYLQIDSDVIQVKLKDFEPNEVKDQILLSYRNNKITVNFSKVMDLLFYIKKVSFKKDSIVTFEDLSPALYSNASVVESGLYTIVVEYEGFNGVGYCLTFDFHATYSALSSSSIINSNNLPRIKNHSILFRILYAFILREFQRKYDKGYFRYLSILIGPAVQVVILVTIFTLMGKRSFFGLNIPLFVLTGIIPYNFFTTAGNCLTIISNNKTLLNYKQVKIIDVILACVVMELLVTISVFSGGVIFCWYFGIVVILYNPLSLLLAFSLLFLLTLGFAMILSVVGYYFAEFNYAIQVIFRALFYISGVFFSIESIPVQYQKYLLWNPLLQLVEYIRFSFIQFQLPYELSYLYLFKWVIAVCLFGISMYFVNRYKFLVNDQARI